MFGSGPQVSKSSERAIRNIALIATPIFVAYNMMVLFGFVPSSSYISDTVCLIISGVWLGLGILHYFVSIKSKADIFLRLFLYQFLALSTIVFITGFMAPFASSVAILFMAFYIYFGAGGFTFSLLSVVIAAFFDILMRYQFNPDILFENIAGLIAILAFGIALTFIISAQETRRQSLIHSRSKERLQYDRVLTIINNLTDATVTMDKNGTIQLYNAALLDLVDSNEDLKGRNVSSLFNLTDQAGEAVKLFDIIGPAERATMRDDLVHTYKDDDQIRLEITFAPIRGADSKSAPVGAGYIAIMRDVTKMKSLEEERDEFISVVSHELRTPITIMEGALSNVQLMFEKGHIDPKTGKEIVDMAHDKALYLAKMVNDLSTLSRAERGGKFDTGEVMDVTELLHKMYDQYAKEAKSKGLKLDLNLSPKLGNIKASRLYVEELLQNFITNAIKYTQKGTVTITGSRKKDTVTFAVKDSGIGISRTDQQKIFQKFYRSEDYRTRESSGTGLGLYVAAKLAKKLGTRIELSSRLNHGSTFSFSLPVTDEPVSAPPVDIDRVDPLKTST